MGSSTVSVSISLLWTNKTFADDLCSKISSIGATLVTKVTVGRKESTDLPFNEHMLMPDCFWKLTALEEIYAESVIFTGSQAAGSQADPLLRFPSALTRIGLVHCRFVNPNVRGATFKINWTTFLPSQPLLKVMSFDDAKLEGTLPPFIPGHITEFYENNPMLAGTIPAALFSNYSASATRASLYFGFSGNGINGTIPSTLFTNILPSGVDFSNNALNGTIPDFSTLSWDGASQTYLMFSSNKLTGTLPANIFGTNFWGASDGTSIELHLDNNELSGTIPESLFEHRSAQLGGRPERKCLHRFHPQLFRQCQLVTHDWSTQNLPRQQQTFGNDSALRTLACRLYEYQSSAIYALQ